MSVFNGLIDLLFQMTRLIGKNNAIMQRSNQLSVEIRIKENTMTKELINVKNDYYSFT